MARERVVIVGGGIAGLTCAWHLSRTPELRERYEVELIEARGVPGGKLASTRDPEQGWRSLEHGLHVWFGFYENAFALVREVHERWRRPEGCPLQTWKDAFRPHSFTPIGRKVQGEVGWFPVQWPTNADEPGDGRVQLTGWGAVTQALSTFQAAVRVLLLKAGVPLPAKARRPWRTGPLVAFEGLQLNDVDGLRSGLQALDRLIRPLVAPYTAENVDAHAAMALLEVGLAFFLGLLDPKWGVHEDWDLSRIDHLDFREWLIEAGGDPDVVKHWGGVKALYDTTFQVQDGRPSFAAGVAARVVIRVCTQYNGAVLYHLNAGMGEAVIAPLWEVLEDQGVRLRLGCRLVGLDRVELRPVEEPLLDWRGLRVWNEGVRLGDPTEEALSWEHLVLALPLPAHRGEAWLAALREDARFSRMLDAPSLVKTEAVQLWMPKTLEGMGWTRARPALVGWPHPMSIWADMSHLLPLSDTDARSLHYFCGPHRPGRDWEEQLDRRLGREWPDADWRLGERYHRVNEQGSELVVGSPPEAVKARLGPSSGHERIWLAGAWTHNGLDASCVEGAVMSGMQAARAISGSPEEVVGEGFLWGAG